MSPFPSTFTKIHRDLYQARSRYAGFGVGIVARGPVVRRRVFQWLAVTRHGAVVARFPRRKDAVRFLRENFTNYTPSAKGF